MVFISDKATWTIFHQENCLAGMQLLASPAIIRNNWLSRPLQQAQIMWPLGRFLKLKPKLRNIAQMRRY